MSVFKFDEDTTIFTADFLQKNNDEPKDYSTNV